MSKSLTGIGYILTILGILIAVGGAFIPNGYVLLGGYAIAVIGFLLINIGFIMMGRKYGKGAWTATGIIGIIVFILALAGVAIIAGAIIQALSTSAVSEGLVQIIAGAAGLIGIAGILGFVWIIMEIIVLWSAAGYFQSGALKGAAILKIIVLIIGLIGLPVAAIGGFMGALSSGSPEAVIAAGGLVIVLLGLEVLLAIVAQILAGIGFMAAKEQTYAAPAYGAQVAPPPPPA